MRRVGSIYHKVYDRDNIELADDNARRHKKNNWGIKKHDRHRESDNDKLEEDLKNLVYHTSPYSTFKIYEPKERVIFRLPYFPDRIAHHAIMNVTEPIWVKTFIVGTYSCIKERGIHKCLNDLKRALARDKEGTMYCLKLDIKKFYPSIDHRLLKQVIRRKIKDKQLLKLLDEIIDSSDGVPIGNYLSQFFANLFLSYFDHWLKEECKVKYYFRYADDIVILSDSKEFLRHLFFAIKFYLEELLHLEIKPNYQIFPVDSRGIDFVGYKFFHTYILLRKSIKVRMLKLVRIFEEGLISREELRRKLSSYFGWAKFCNSKNLLFIIEQRTGLKFSNWNGKESLISYFYNKTVRFVEVVPYSKYFKIHFIYQGRPYSVNSKSKALYKILLNIEQPVNYTFKQYGKKTN